MAIAESVRDLLNSLQEDKWRMIRGNEFSADLERVSRLLHHPFAYLPEKEEALSLWAQKNQPCIFGQLAAQKGQMHYCILTGKDLAETDDVIRDKIQVERALWKQRALKGGKGTRHGFMLLAAAPELLWAAPDNSLKRFSLKLRELLGCAIQKDSAGNGNDRTLEHLFLKKPNTNRYYKYTFTVDYFAAAGDGRWWIDHRVPGGVAFTANSLGHMARTRQWYEKKKGNQDEWGAKFAMMTIADSQPTPQGDHATRLVDLDQGKPSKPSRCPFANVKKLPQRIQGKDWTIYEGLLHTDHSIRDEFFNGDEKAPTRVRPWRMDFGYIYDRKQSDYATFMGGQLVGEQEVYAEIGSPEDWRVLAPEKSERPKSANGEIAKLLRTFRGWALTKGEAYRISR